MNAASSVLDASRRPSFWRRAAAIDVEVVVAGEDRLAAARLVVRRGPGDRRPAVVGAAVVVRVLRLDQQDRALRRAVVAEVLELAAAVARLGRCHVGEDADREVLLDEVRRRLRRRARELLHARDLAVAVRVGLPRVVGLERGRAGCADALVGEPAVEGLPGLLGEGERRLGRREVLVESGPPVEKPRLARMKLRPAELSSKIAAEDGCVRGAEVADARLAGGEVDRVTREEEAQRRLVLRRARDLLVEVRLLVRREVRAHRRDARELHRPGGERRRVEVRRAACRPRR